MKSNVNRSLKSFASGSVRDKFSMRKRLKDSENSSANAVSKDNKSLIVKKRSTTRKNLRSKGRRSESKISIVCANSSSKEKKIKPGKLSWSIKENKIRKKASRNQLRLITRKLKPKKLQRLLSQ